ncbi:hypothetical protein VPH49_21750 [Pseudomonas luteola]|uniref:hypothetical protein n=1 Tax=Pseudomonas luteola TaxID=47886 RepID=UPI003A8B237D
MTPEQFCYWLQGRAELVDAPLSEQEWASVKQHLDAVFKKVTPLAPGQWPHPSVGIAALGTYISTPAIPGLKAGELIC